MLCARARIHPTTVPAGTVLTLHANKARGAVQADCCSNVTERLEDLELHRIVSTLMQRVGIFQAVGHQLRTCCAKLWAAPHCPTREQTQPPAHESATSSRVAMRTPRWQGWYSAMMMRCDEHWPLKGNHLRSHRFMQTMPASRLPAW